MGLIIDPHGKASGAWQVGKIKVFWFFGPVEDLYGRMEKAMSDLHTGESYILDTIYASHRPFAMNKTSKAEHGRVVVGARACGRDTFQLKQPCIHCRANLIFAMANRHS
jgi:hypothetical protein